jgi:ADP-ribose pyrophosphatase YjhB (NUDIX family)
MSGLPSRLSPWPVVAVGAIVWKEDRILLIRRGRPPRQGQWSIPGGRQEAGETIQQAARREIREEAGIEIDILDIAAVVDLIDRDDGELRHHYTVIDMLAEWRSGEAVAGDDALEVAWLRESELAGLGLPDLQRQVIAEAARKRRARAA